MMFFLQRLPVFFLCILLTTLSINGSAQCITNFPYTESFENSNGNWTPGGTASDWAWGTPSKSIISKAGNGQKCWVAGGLTGSFYNNDEKSWLQSQCFDFSKLKNPFLSFLVNWNTEGGFDGAALQYSTDNGITWQSAGTYGEPTGCTNNNWYNTSAIMYGFVSNADGWSGLGTGGNHGWVTAYHSFPKLAGKTNVIFRFVFGAGNKNNNYNGFAVDDIYIGETATNQLSFTYTCTSTPRQASFTAQTNGCINTSSLQWSFGDPVSGSENMAAGNNVLHQFSDAASYTVTVTGKDNQNNIITSVPQTILIPDVTATVKTPVACFGGTGIVEAAVNNATTGVSYTWSGNPAITTSTAQLKAGTYDVTASVAGGCPNTTSVPLSEPAALTHTLTTTPADCNNQNGSITITESGGTIPYRYTWQGIQYTTPSANNLPSGNYSIHVTDKNACLDFIAVSLPKTASTLSQTVETTTPDCGVTNGSIKLITTGGAPGYSYVWTPAVSTTSTASNLVSGTYSVTTTDKDNCQVTTGIPLSSNPVAVSLGRDTFICKDQTLLLKPSGNFASFLWNDGSAASTKLIGKDGYYWVTVTNTGGCTASDTVHISSGCGDLVFPSVFTPNGDGLNEQFGPFGGLSLVSSYQLLVYNRFGNIVFRSVSPYQKWKGDVSGKKLTGAYTYMVTYTYDGERKMKKGTIVLFF